MDADRSPFEEEVLERICAVCIERRDDGSCGVDPKLECSIKLHLPTILETVRGVTSDRIGEYVERIRRNVCQVCVQQNRDGSCDVRERIDCPLDRYLVLVVEAIEDVQRRRDAEEMASAP